MSFRRAGFWALLAVGLLVVGVLLREVLPDVDEVDFAASIDPLQAYFLCALLVFADGVCALFPAETTLITASTLAVAGVLDVGPVIVAGAVGAVTGDSALYWLARLSRRRFQKQVETAMRNDKVADAMDLIGSSAPLLLVVGRYVPGLRFVVNATCGLAGYPFRQFLLWSTIGGIAWSVVTCLTAYLLATALGDNPLAALVLASLVSTFAVGIIFVLVRRQRAQRSSGTAPVAHP